MKRRLTLLIVLAVLLGVAQNGFHVIEEGEQGILTQFGKPMGGVKEAGLHFKIPFIQELYRFQKRILSGTAIPTRFLPGTNAIFFWIQPHVGE